MEAGERWRLGRSGGWGAVEVGEQWRLGSGDFVHGDLGWSLNGTWNCLLGRGASEFTQEEWSYVLNPDLLIMLIVSVRKVSLSGGVFVADGVPSTEYFLSSVLVEDNILFHPLPLWRDSHAITTLRRRP